MSTSTSPSSRRGSALGIMPSGLAMDTAARAATVHTVRRSGGKKRGRATLMVCSHTSSRMHTGNTMCSSRLMKKKVVSAPSGRVKARWMGSENRGSTSISRAPS